MLTRKIISSSSPWAFKLAPYYHLSLCIAGSWLCHWVTTFLTLQQSPWPVLWGTTLHSSSQVTLSLNVCQLWHPACASHPWYPCRHSLSVCGLHFASHAWKSFCFTQEASTSLTSRHHSSPMSMWEDQSFWNQLYNVLILPSMEIPRYAYNSLTSSATGMFIYFFCNRFYPCFPPRNMKQQYLLSKLISGMFRQFGEVHASPYLVPFNTINSWLTVPAPTYPHFQKAWLSTPGLLL